MTPITNHFINTDKLSQFASFLRNDVKKITDALFVENLIKAINEHPEADISRVDMWLKAAFGFKQNFDDNNCIDIYNMSLYHMIREKL